MSRMMSHIVPCSQQRPNVEHLLSSCAEEEHRHLSVQYMEGVPDLWPFLWGQQEWLRDLRSQPDDHETDSEDEEEEQAPFLPLM